MALADRAYVYLVEPSRDPALMGWQAALAGRESTRANVVLIGASTVEGYPLTDFDRTTAQELARALRIKFPTTGLGASGGRGRIGIPSRGLTPPLPTPLTFTGGTFDPVAYNVTPALHFGASHTCWYTATASHKVTLTLLAHETALDIVHVAGPSGHVQAGYYRVNGGPPVPFSTHNATNTIRNVRIEGPGLLQNQVDGGDAEDISPIEFLDGGDADDLGSGIIDGGTAVLGGTGQPMNGGTAVPESIGFEIINGGDADDVATDVLDGGVALVSDGGGELTPEALIEIGCSGTGMLILSELIAYGGDEDKGILVHGVGHVGYRAAQLAAAPTTAGGWRAALANLEPDIIAIEVGVADAIDNTASAFAIGLQTLINNIRSVGGPIPTCPILLIAPYRVEGNQPMVEPWSYYVAEMRGIANSDPLISFTNQADRMPDTDATNTYGLYHSNGILANPNGKANAMQAQLTAEALSYN